MPTEAEADRLLGHSPNPSAAPRPVPLPSAPTVAAVASDDITPSPSPPIQTRARSSSNAPTLLVGSSSTTTTPTQLDPSPLAHRLARAPGPPPPSSGTLTAPPVAPSSLYDATTRRNLIARAAADGDLARLEALLLPPAARALANEPNPHTGLAPVHFAAQNGHDDVVKWLVEEAGALPDLKDAGGEVRRHRPVVSLLHPHPHTH